MHPPPTDLNVTNPAKNQSQFWWRPFFFFFFFFFFGDHLNLGEKNVWISDFGRKISLNFGEDIRIFEVLCFKSPPPKFSGSATGPGVRRATRLLRKGRAWIRNVRVWVINPHVQLHFHLWLRWSWRYKSKAKLSRLKTVQIEQVRCWANSQY